VTRLTAVAAAGPDLPDLGVLFHPQHIDSCVLLRCNAPWLSSSSSLACLRPGCVVLWAAGVQGLRLRATVPRLIATDSTFPHPRSLSGLPVAPPPDLSRLSRSLRSDLYQSAVASAISGHLLFRVASSDPAADQHDLLRPRLLLMDGVGE